ncbi:MAG: type I DNA topoisomerase [Deltaproteobacteria bacterium]|nr:type I DNA topoisomerase [Deltaproteobacteria bacterium]
MEKSLLIVESPTKVRTIKKYLGPEFEVKASLGHIKDLPPNLLGVDIEQAFKPEFQIISGKNKVLKELKQAARKASHIYLAPDPDREGEAIAWHIAEELSDKDKSFHRVLFHELSKRAILEALQKPEPLNEPRFQSQLARRILDRLVGYQISPLLWQKVKKGLSAGRVQSVAVRLICDREREIQVFVSREYWSITALLTPGETDPDRGAPAIFEAKLVKIEGKAAKVTNQEQAENLVAGLAQETFRVVKLDRKERLRHPTAPFTTSQLQQEAFRKLRFPAKKTMFLAQRLYEGVEVGSDGLVGLITYMRTDSTRVSKEAVEAVREHIQQRFGPDYLPARPLTYPNKKGAQDAHEAIRPTAMDYPPEAIASFLEKDLLALYRLIWNRFVASQMKPARIDQTSVDIAAGKTLFRATGSVLKFPGFTSLYVVGKDTEEEENGEKGGRLPLLQTDQVLGLEKLLPKQHFTQPPPRYTEATLVKELEEKGIGRPSTYAAIISTIQDKEYVKKEKQLFHPTELGFLVTDLLVKNFPDILDVQFTANMENNLDLIEEGKLNWVEVLENFYQPFAQTLVRARSEMEQIKGQGIPTDIVCPKCQKAMTIRLGRNGPFLACSGYPQCRQTMNFTRDEKGRIQPETASEAEGEAEKICAQCGKPMVVRRGKFGSFWACSGYPQCTETLPYAPGGAEAEPPSAAPTGQVCPTCGSAMILKKNRFGGQFLACEKYPKCKTARALETDMPCPQTGCTGNLVSRVTKKGLRFYGCSRYPECSFLLWGKPVKQTCPQCQSPLMVEKTSKKEGTFLACIKKECGYKETKAE